MSYARFIRFGFSKRIDFQELTNKCRLIKLNKTRIDPNKFYSKVLLAIGFSSKEFKIGNDAVFFRSNKFEILEKIFSDMTEPRPVPKGKLQPK